MTENRDGLGPRWHGLIRDEWWKGPHGVMIVMAAWAAAMLVPAVSSALDGQANAAVAYASAALAGLIAAVCAARWAVWQGIADTLLGPTPERVLDNREDDR